MFEALAANRTLESFTINFQTLTMGLAKAMVKVIKTNTVLQTLDVTGKHPTPRCEDG